jgi:5-methylcytosine-specific restriction endonuclease McrA
MDLAGQVPPLGRHNHKLFERDRRLCAYCGEVFPVAILTREHIRPLSQRGPDTWMNVVTACKGCNHRKGPRTPEQARMPLLYLPYTPNWFEDFLLQKGGKKILADQMEFLLSRVSQESRLRQ